MEQRVKDAADRATEIAKTYSHGQPRLAAEHGLALACKDQPASFKEAVRAELRTRGYRI